MLNVFFGTLALFRIISFLTAFSL